MKYKIAISLLCLLQFTLLKGQDVHFTQFYQQPPILNPALTGASGCHWRVGSNYRSQWASVGNPFVTEDAYAEYSFIPKFLRGGWLGIGAIIIDDKAGPANLKKTDFSGSIAYHQDIGSAVTLHAGFNAGSVNKSVNAGTLTFDDQWTGTEFSTGITTAEPISESSLFYMNYNAGLAFDIRTGGTKYEFGAGIIHLNKPKDSFYGTQDLPRRYNVHAATEMGKGNLTFYPGAVFTLQGTSKELVLGTNVSFPYKDVTLFLGLWHRVVKDITPLGGFRYKDVTFLISYDLNLSKTRLASNMFGGPEASLQWKFGCDSKNKNKGHRKGKVPKYSPPRKKPGRSHCPAYD